MKAGHDAQMFCRGGWIMTLIKEDTGKYEINNYGSYESNSIDIIPVIKLKNNLKIKGGNGTQDEPYYFHDES